MPNKLEELAQTLERRISEKALSQRLGSVHKPSGFRASESGIACARYHYHCIKDWELRPSVPPELAGIFLQGLVNERELVKDLLDSGIEFQELQSAYEDKELGVVGKIDGIIKLNGNTYPVEIKSVSPHYFETIEKYEDITPREDRPPYFAAWSAQLPMYLRLTESDSGFYILRNKVNRATKVIPVTADQSREIMRIVESSLKKAKKAIEAGKPPHPAPAFSNLCDECWCLRVGLCPGVHKKQIESIEELPKEAIATIAKEMIELKPKAKRYERLRDELNKIISGIADKLPLADTAFFAADILVTVKRYEQRYYDVPEEIKKDYERKRVVTRVEVK